MRLSKMTIMPKFKSDVANWRLWTRKVVVIGLALFFSTPLAAAADREMTQEFVDMLARRRKQEGGDDGGDQ